MKRSNINDTISITAIILSTIIGLVLADVVNTNTSMNPDLTRHIEEIPIETEIVEIDCTPTVEVDQYELRRTAIHEAKRLEAETLKTYDDYEIALMAKVVRAEAGNQDDVGKRLVVDCILNRLDSDNFPNTIKGVIEQKNQFESYPWYTQDDWDAVADEIVDRTDDEIVFFRTDRYSTHGEPAYQYGDHYFSTM